MCVYVSKDEIKVFKRWMREYHPDWQHSYDERNDILGWGLFDNGRICGYVSYMRGEAWTHDKEWLGDIFTWMKYVEDCDPIYRR